MFYLLLLNPKSMTSVRRQLIIFGMRLVRFWHLKYTQSTPVEQYLLNISIDVLSLPSMPDTIRFIPSAFYRNEEAGKTESYPAMLTAVRDLGGRLVTVHRTFLTEDGWKAPVTTPKRLMALP